MTATYQYSMARLVKDETGIYRETNGWDATAQEVEAITLGRFQGAADLDDGVEYADGTDEAGNRVRVYRWLAE